jgi:hypothetical protein
MSRPPWKTASRERQPDIPVKDKQFSKADLAISESFEPASITTLDRLRQPEKHTSPIVLTEPGMLIDDNHSQPENPESSIRDSFENREPDSNVTVEIAVHVEKQDSQRISTDEGMQMDERDEQPANPDFGIFEI